MIVTSNSTTSNIREHARELSQQYKTAWIQLGQALYTVHKEKGYREWGYLSFQAYCVKELGLKEITANKILKSYSFLEKEEPRFVQREYLEEEKPEKVPNFESVNLLRLAKGNEKITASDFSQLREAVLEKAREPKEVRTQVKKIIQDKEDPDSPQLRDSRRAAVVKRLITTLKHAGKELQSDKLIPAYLLKQIAELTAKLEDQLQ